jgi:serine/threonine-protein kinase
MTQAGVIVGTPAYMSPEQLRGGPLDRRTDGWSLGVVLYEMLTGRALFTGDSVSEVMASVLTREPDWEAVPIRLRRLLRRCLERDPNKRLRHAADLVLLLDEPAEPAPAGPAPRSPTPSWAWATAGGLVLVITVAWWAWRPADQSSRPMQVSRTAVPQPDDLEFTDLFSLSPDGRTLAFVGTSDTGAQIWIRELATDRFRPIDDTRSNNAVNLSGLVWAPDGQSIAYWYEHEEELRRTSVSGGTQRIAGGVTGAVQSGYWSDDDRIVFVYSGSNGVWQVPVGGGMPTRVTTGNHWYPSPLPDGRFIYTDWGTVDDVHAAYVGSLDEERAEPVRLLTDVDAAAYVASPNDAAEGYLLLLRGGTLSAVRFDPRSLERRGSEAVIATDVTRRGRPATGSSGAGQFIPPGFSAAPRSLVYRMSEPAAVQLTWFDVDGRSLETVGEIGTDDQLSLSPDTRQLAVVRQREAGTSRYDIWIQEMNGPDRSRPLTVWPDADISPVWSFDGRRIFYASYRENEWHIYERASDGTGDAEPLDVGEPPVFPSSASPDGRFLLFQRGIASDIWLLSLENGAASALVASEALEGSAQFAPNGRWLSYNSNRTGQMEIWVQAFDPSPGAVTRAVQASVGGSFMSRWAGDQLFYTTNPDKVMMVVDIADGPDGNPVAGEPRALFDANPATDYWDVASDGDRFIMPVSVSGGDASAFRLVQDWTAAVNER